MNIKIYFSLKFNAYIEISYFMYNLSCISSHINWKVFGFVILNKIKIIINIYFYFHKIWNQIL